mmetsp:Transcript_4068/g.8759  ORF Transcript_4068/g.8759 Transcript_4068/m.8759 type:complete len:428 (+) Transcript_4068:469-1752(+)|eukprot:CAMPEP_0171487996 /NCGR_PEP_ID=MMETSP0958-20121227/1962_1 /TAXON_ID=87120 /ORGANISM="Aurantiochytrium limacinum, Strain ATCCMYA-1381" /LENGTH=427 /DNA_ID=CAMNT_0012021061 /DNA_START=319 /DNA_END=1602 /DNA_ORIENTATION=-
MFLWKQKILGGGDKEPEGFKEKKRECLAMRDGLKKCEKAVRAWMEGAAKMSSAAQTMADLAGSSDQGLMRLGTQIANELGPEKSLKVCQDAVNSIELKIKLVDKLKKESTDLEEKRLIMNRLKRKLDDANKKDDAMAKDKAKAEHDEAVNVHAQLFAEVDGSFDFLQEEDQHMGGVGLAKPEMSAFKQSTVNFFRDCAAVCEGLVQEINMEDVDLTSEWTRFNDRKDAKVMALRDSKMAMVGSSRGLNSAEDDNQYDSGSSRLDSNDSYHTAAGSSYPPPPPVPSSGGGAPPPPPPPPPAGSSSGSYGQPPQRPPSMRSTRPPPPPHPSQTQASPAPPPPPPPPSQSSYAKPSGLQATALYAYSPQNVDELALQVGQVVTITKQEEDGWWEGVLPNGRRGVFPSNYVSLNSGGGYDDDDDSDLDGNV